MSMHKIPLTKIELDGLIAHGLDIGTPSQLSDVFRLGVAHGQKSERERLAKKFDEQSNISFYGAAIAKELRKLNEESLNEQGQYEGGVYTHCLRCKRGEK